MRVICGLLLIAVLLPMAACKSAPEQTSKIESWAIISSPIDVWAGNDGDEIYIWSQRVFRDVYASQSDCEAALVVQKTKHPPGYNMAYRCTSPHPSVTPLMVMSAEELGLEEN